MMTTEHEKKVADDAYLILTGTAAFALAKEISLDMLDKDANVIMPCRLVVSIVDAYRIAVRRLMAAGLMNVEAGSRAAAEMIVLNQAQKGEDDGGKKTH